MNDDRFMASLQQPPDPDFARDLGARLRRIEREMAAEGRPPRTALAPRLALTFAAIAAVVAAFLLPGVRASAQAFLNLFRVQNFVAIRIDAARLDQLTDSKLDLQRVFNQSREVLLDPGTPRPLASVAEAGVATGQTVRVPSILPGHMAADTVWVQGEGRMRMTADAKRVREAMDLMGVRDLPVPAGLDGAALEVHTFPMVRQTFTSGGLHAFLLQSRSPELSLPATLQLADLGEIALRILGMSPSEAHAAAARIDWRSTVLVPVPADAGSFREVTVQGQKGLLVTRAERADGKGRKRSPGALVLWSDGQNVYAAGGNIATDDVLAMAESAR